MSVDFKGAHYPKSVILYAVYFYVRYGVSYRDLEEIMEERGAEVDHATLNRWVVKFSPMIAANAQARKRPTAVSWRMDETYIKVKGRWTYYYRAVDNTGKTLDFMLSERRNKAAARRFFKRAIGTNGVPGSGRYRQEWRQSGGSGKRQRHLEVHRLWEHDQDPPGQIPQQHRGTGPPFHKTDHAPHAWLQGLPFSRRYTGWDRDSTHDPKGATRDQRAHRIPAVCGARSISASTEWPPSIVKKVCDRTIDC